MCPKCPKCHVCCCLEMSNYIYNNSARQDSVNNSKQGQIANNSSQTEVSWSSRYHNVVKTPSFVGGGAEILMSCLPTSVIRGSIQWCKL